MNTLRARPPDFKRERDLLYLGIVRDLPCCVGGFPCVAAGRWQYEVHPHHLISRGAGGSDLGVIPLCPAHHAEIHQLGVVAFEAKYNLDVWAECASALACYVRSLKEDQ